MRMGTVRVGLALGLGLALAAGLAALGGCSSGKWSDSDVAETVKRGDEIVAALEKYKKDKNEYPKSLDELKPSYLSEIPDPTVGTKKWDYRLGELKDTDANTKKEMTIKSFELSVSNKGGFPNAFFDSSNPTGWQIQQELKRVGEK